MALVKFHGRKHKVSRGLVNEWLNKRKIGRNWYLAGQSILVATLRSNLGELIWSFGLKIGHQIYMKMYNTKWVGVMAKNSVFIKFHRDQVIAYPSNLSRP